MAPIQGVVGIVLFGSLARGDADEYSDIDLLILFEDRASMKKGWDEVFRATGPMRLNINAIPETLDELANANPIFLRELEKDGKILYSRDPFRTAMRSPATREFSIVSYRLSSLSYPEKMRVLYRLYKGKGGGMVGNSGGMKLGPGLVLVPMDARREVVDLLGSRGAKCRSIDVLVEEKDPNRWSRPEFGNHGKIPSARPP